LEVFKADRQRIPFKLTGTFPKQLSELKNLKVFHINGNNIHGTIPTQFSMLSNLQQLYFGSNPLISGTIPENFGFLSKLIQIDFGQTNLTGSCWPFKKNIFRFCRLDNISFNCGCNVPSFANCTGQLPCHQ